MVIWTRSEAGADGQQAATAIGDAFEASGFREVVRESTTPPGFVVATHRLDGQPLPLQPEQALFRFTDYTRLQTA